MRMPVDTLLSNWASMVMTALAWTLKAWFGLRLPETGRWATRYAAERFRLSLIRTLHDSIIFYDNCHVVLWNITG